MSLLSLSYGLLVLLTVPLYALIPSRFRALTLCLVSLLFYAWGSLPHAALILALGGVVFVLGERLQSERRSTLFALGVSLCVAVLCYFKYSVLFLRTVASVLPV